MPPETRKKIQTLTTSDMPKANAMYNKLAVLVKGAPVEVVVAALGRLAVWAAAKPMSKNMVVPIYSEALK
jgi:hypothetical protein